MNMKKFIHKYLGWLYLPVKMPIYNYRHRQHVKRLLKATLQELNSLPKDKAIVYYLGVTNHQNLGDLAQHFCILRWIGQNYADYVLVKVESDVVVEQHEAFMLAFKKTYKEGDVIIFQSGYTTQDLGGNHEEMHRIICDEMSQAHILMMPQTIYFQSEENRTRTARSYNQARRMLFLARDAVSFEQAEKMFPDINTRLFPDIVTSLIGEYQFDNSREGICLCVRNDGEKLYGEKEISSLVSRLKQVAKVSVKDTQSRKSVEDIRRNLQQFIENEIESYSHYKVTITDRYHGTIFSLIAGTPVIILKTTDHKVTTGADWFKGVYDGYVYVAEDLNDANRQAQKLLMQGNLKPLSPYFAENYYAKLKKDFEQI